MSVGFDPRKRLKDIDTVTLGWVAVPVALYLIWLFASTVVGEFALAPPAAAVEQLIDGFTEGWIITDLRITMVELTVAYGLAILAGVWVGVLLGLSDFWQDVFEPIILGVYSIPKVTLYPLFLFIFQLGMDSKIAFGWFHGVFPIAILTMSAMATIRPEHLKVARSFDLSRLQTFREIVVPSILPGLVIGLRLGFNLTFLGIILGEMFAARAGLGYTLIQYMLGVQVARMLAVILLLVVIAAVVNVAFFALERRLGARGQETAELRM